MVLLSTHQIVRFEKNGLIRWGGGREEEWKVKGEKAGKSHLTWHAASTLRKWNRTKRCEEKRGRTSERERERARERARAVARQILLVRHLYSMSPLARVVWG